MKDMAAYLENAFRDTPYDDVLLRFERERLGEWEALSSRVREAGLRDENVTPFGSR